jgi:WD40 repeat protein
MLRGAACVWTVIVLVCSVRNAQSGEPLPADRLPDGAVVRLGQSRLALTGEAYSAAFSPDGTMLAVAANQGFDPDNNVHLFDIRTGLELVQLSAANRGNPRGIVLSFSNDGARLLSGDTVWDTASWIRRRPQFNHSVLAVAPNEKSVAVHGERPNELVIWDVPKSIAAATIATSNDAQCISKAIFSPEGKTLAVSDDTGHLPPILFARFDFRRTENCSWAHLKTVD